MHTRSALIALIACASGAAAAEFHGPWRLAELQKAPKVDWIDTTGAVRKLFYTGEPFHNQPTRVFAYYAEPEGSPRKAPAMVLVHGGGGTAFKEWAELWAKRGYVALAMDLAGCGPDRKRLPEGGPDQGNDAKFPPQRAPLSEVWTYHAVAAVIRGVSLLKSLPNVDADKIGITGISWGGYLTCIVAGLDDRLKVAVPVYGCGFIYHNSAWIPTFEKLPSEWRKEWVKNFDPSKYLGQAKMPVLFVNGTNDFAYPLDSYQKSYRLVDDRTLCITVNMPHSHPAGWAPKEIGAFVDKYLKDGKAFPTRLNRSLQIQPDDGKKTVTLGIAQTAGVEEANLHWTADVSLPWQKRKWHTRRFDKSVGDFTDFYRAEPPAERPIVIFATVRTKDGLTVSTEHQTVEK